MAHDSAMLSYCLLFQLSCGKKNLLLQSLSLQMELINSFHSYIYFFFLLSIVKEIFRCYAQDNNPLKKTRQSNYYNREELVDIA